MFLCLPSPNAPVPDAILALSAQPVILFDSELSYTKKTESDGRSVRESDVHEYVVPPALPEVRQNVLPGEFHEFVQDAPEVADPEIAEDKRGQQPVNPMHDIVVVHLVPHMLKGELTVLIVGVHLLGHRLIQLRVQKPEDLSAALRTL